MHEVLVNRLGGLSLPRKSVVRLTDRSYMTLDVYWDVKQQYNNNNNRTSGLASAIHVTPAVLYFKAFCMNMLHANTSRKHCYILPYFFLQKLEY